MIETKVFKSDVKVPKFATEAEEAKWWYDNEDLMLTNSRRRREGAPLAAVASRRLFAETGIPFPGAKATPTPTTTIRLAPEDIAKARIQAEKRGLRYQTYLKMIIHEALISAEIGRKEVAA